MDAEEATKTQVNLIGSEDIRSLYKNQLMFFYTNIQFTDDTN